MIATSNGPVYKDAKFAIEAYKDWSSDKVVNHVVIPFVSMHGSTKIMVEHLVDQLIDKGIKVSPHNLIGCDIGKLSSDLVDCATIVLAGPQVLAGPHPAVANAAFLTNMLRPKAKYLTVMGSFGWGGKMVDMLAAMIPNVKAEILEPVMIKGMPDEETLVAVEELADTILAKHTAEDLI